MTQEASSDDLGALIRNTAQRGFALALLTVNINGFDTVFAQGPGALLNQSQVDAKFRPACGLGRGSVYLTHVRYDPVDGDAAQLRVR